MCCKVTVLPCIFELYDVFVFVLFCVIGVLDIGLVIYVNVVSLILLK